MCNAYKFILYYINKCNHFFYFIYISYHNHFRNIIIKDSKNVYKNNYHYNSYPNFSKYAVNITKINKLYNNFLEILISL